MWSCSSVVEPLLAENPEEGKGGRKEEEEGGKREGEQREVEKEDNHQNSRTGAGNPIW